MKQPTPHGSDGLAIADTHRAVTVEETRLDLDGFRRVETIFYREDGSGLRARRELVRAQEAVAVVIRDPATDRMVLIRQYRHGATLAQGRGFCVELVAGLIDEGEDPAETARRETMEESGLAVTRMEHLTTFMTTPGLADEVLHVFYAEADAGDLTDRAGAEEESEETLPFTCTLDEALRAIDTGAVGNGILMVALLMYARRRDALLGNGS